MDLQDMPTFAFWTRTDRDTVALIGPDGTQFTVGTLQDQANQIARQLQARGLTPGDAVGMCMGNCPEVFALALATAQIGLYLVPISRHLTRHEVGYILADSEARAVVCGADQVASCSGGEAMVFAVGGGGGAVDFSELTAGDSSPPESRTAGGVMTYTSGTTGQPKGVRRPLPPAPPEPIASAYAMFLLMYGMQPGAGVHLVVSPLYHTAVLYFGTSALHLGMQVVVMDKWTAEGMLERIDRYGVTNSHMVPTQFVRLLEVENKERFDVSSLKHMVHGAAPCPDPVKRAMLQWWGPTVYEYYAASEGGGTMITPTEWLEKPGSVGKPWATAEIAIMDEDGARLGADEVGTVYIKMQQAFEYHRDKDKTDAAWRSDGFFTVGDAGYLDGDGYLYLCDRKADMIISGGVNIYPAEIEGVLHAHPAVLDVAVFGIPDEDWGEQVKAVVEVKAEAGPAMESELLTWARERLAKFKCPRSIDFVDALPREENGKLKKRLLRDPYWQGRERQI